MSRFSADSRLSSAQASFALNESSIRFRHATAILCGALLAPVALADEHANHVEELSPTVITAIAPSSPLTIVTNPKDPRQPVPASDGADYLKTIPGFAMVRNGGTNGDPVLRGMFGSRLNILTNGGMMLGACPGRMDAPTSYISPETYDKLTVIKGPQTVLWGPGASAGTILFDREPERFGELGTRVNASVLAGSNGRFDKLVDAAAGGPLGYVRVIGNTAHSDDYRDGNNDTVAVALRQMERRRRCRLDPGRRHLAGTDRRQGRRRSPLRRARHGRLAVQARKPRPALREVQHQ